MKIFKYLFEHKVAVFIVFVLLCCQAFCDLAIPNVTSNIVDVGIQQSGVEHAAVDEMTAKTYEEIEESLQGSQKELFSQSYTEADDGHFVLNDYGKSKIDDLDDAIEKPLAQIWGFSSGADDSTSTQAGIAAALKEYSAVGKNVADIQISYLLVSGAWMLGFAALASIIAIAVGYISSITGSRIGRDLRKRVFSKVMEFSSADVEKFSEASLITRGTNDIQLIQNVSMMLLRMVLYAPILAIGGIIMVVTTNAQMGWIVACAVVLVGICISVLFALTMPKFKIMQKLIDKVNLISREMLTGLPVIRAFNRQDYEQQRFDVASKNLMATQLFTNRAMSFMMPAIMLIMNLTSVAIVWFGGIKVDEGTLQTGDLIAFITYAMVIIMGFLMIGMIAVMMPRADVSVARVNEVLDTNISLKVESSDHACGHSGGEQPQNGKLQNDTAQEAQDNPVIEFCNVSFKYGDQCDWTLEDINFKVMPGDTFAIIGSTGSGKSTILKLILRFYDATLGTVKINGRDIRSMPWEQLRRSIGYAPQKPFLFSGTVDTNVAYSDEGMTEDRVENSLRLAQAKQFVDAMDKKVDSPITEGGTNVSGGQRQRISIARAIASNAECLLFDDSFSALDFKTDSELRAALKHELPKTTKVIVAQRIATVMDADQILVIDEGKIAGLGTHDELMQNCDIYREIATSQLSSIELGLEVTTND